jgi:hypothetical protein
MLKRYPILFGTAFFSITLLTAPAHSRLNKFSAGLTTGADFSETSYDKDELNEGVIVPSRNSRSTKLSVGPIFIFESSSSTDELLINYRPSYVYDSETNDSDMDHNLSLSGYSNVSKELRFDLSENFIYSDDPDLVTDDSSSDYNKGRKRYWTNTFNIKSTYTYDKQSFLGGGYTYRVLQNEDTGIGGYENYDKHTGDLFLTHRFNSSWNIASSISYTKGLFDPPEQEVLDRVESGLESIAESSTANINNNDLSNDLSEYHASAIVNWIFTPAKTLQTRYTFSASNYDAILRNDSILHNLSFGAQYQYSKRLSFGFGGGPSYEKTDTYDANWNYNAYLNVKYSISQRTTFSANAEKGYEQDNFSSNNNQLGRDQGLTEFTDWQLDFSHKLLKNLDLSLFASYRDERQENIVHGIVTVIEDGTNLQGTDREDRRELSAFDRDIYRAGITLKYSFMQYWNTAFTYSYRRQNSERINDSYDENRAYLTLSVQNEIFRW